MHGTTDLLRSHSLGYNATDALLDISRNEGTTRTSIFFFFVNTDTFYGVVCKLFPQLRGEVVALSVGGRAEPTRP